MTNYLLDTHVVIWLMFDSTKISDASLGIIKNPENGIYVSAVSFWEISVKHRLGKLNLNNFSPSALPDIYSDQGFQLLPLSPADASSLYQLNTDHHRDPFDRMLIWQAIRKSMIFISNDGNMPPYRSEGLRLFW